MAELDTARPGSGGPFLPGQTRMIDAKDKSGNVLKTYTVYRTEREYVYDLCDAYNAKLDRASKERGMEWFVAPSGELKLGDSAEWSRQNRRRIERRLESERARYLRHQLEPVT